ncbi:hypothetical protein BofuT4_P121520.1 [Botrytis cinerea T4]|uniref:Uncharacterized protein n=1 Tax=Botryotinia fuckeliana (strain T4) TaxID=999810 RepID=G2YND5_BOTF4|nr:hypothetical protein BofuT4_P121520.1 [Botrytis cinerea T4]
MGIFNSVRKLFISDRGHTVLGNLMMAILKPHTSCPPVTVDGSSKTQIIGREEKLSSVEDETLIRRAWKHMFCRTSVQAICHCTGCILGPACAPDIHTPSGIFMKYCQKYVIRLQL